MIVEHAEHVESNRASWDAIADTYQEQHLADLSPERPAWGIWKIPEDELRVLGDVAGCDVLDIGCGAAQFAISLARRGARPVGLDVSAAQLAHATRLMRDVGVEFTLLHANAEAVPLPDDSFDIVISNWGATTFSDPYKTIPEAARLLRPGGLLAFAGFTPLAQVCWPGGSSQALQQLSRDYFGMHTIVDRADSISFQLPYGEWVRLFRRCGLMLEDIIELRPPADAISTFCGPTDHTWARRWPLEHIWKASKPVQPQAGATSSAAVQPSEHLNDCATAANHR